ncbi:hypothetical protein ABZW30_35950 [Kitasatospora sp. NPDC004669]|uniref:hypothetical protein n=1 Tax=Kitasatospora sp. NPDC004669 TaxID=3154555 RepID=UPI0033A238A4
MAQVADGVVDALAAVHLQPGGAGRLVGRGRDLFGAAAEDGAGVAGDEGFGGRVAGLV